MMKSVCAIHNPIHRLKLRQALQDSKHIEDIEVAILSKQIDVFIRHCAPFSPIIPFSRTFSYRRSTGNQLASLIKVLLQLRGYKVFIDVDKLYAGKFDSHLLKNIQAAKHFILVLTPHSLDRLLNDNNCEDWIHKELHCAFEHCKNVIPIFDQHVLFHPIDPKLSIFPFQFEFPAVESELPDDIRQITRFNGVRWVHDYQEACIDKASSICRATHLPLEIQVERFIKGELNRVPSQSMGSNATLVKAHAAAAGPSVTVSTVANRRAGAPFKLSGPGACPPSVSSRASPTPPGGQPKLQRAAGQQPPGAQHADSIGSNASGSSMRKAVKS